MSGMFKIVIIGNSVALRVRPPKEQPYNLNYGAYLERSLLEEHPGKQILVINKGLSRLLITEVIKNIDEYVSEFPDLYIINLGVVDASTREVPLWFSDIVRKENQNIFYKFLSGIHAHIFQKHRPFFVKLRRKNTWVSERRFAKYYQQLIRELKKETNAKIITISINPGNQRIEAQIPGNLVNYKRYSKLIEKISTENNLFYIDTGKVLEEKHVPDGIHFSSEGHQILAKEVYEILTKQILNEGIS